MGTADEVLEKLRKLRGYRTIIVGIGNTLKGDDGAGPLVCQQLYGKVCAGVMDVGTVPENTFSLSLKAPQRIYSSLTPLTLEPRPER